MKHVLVICDPETEYARRLMEYINRKNTCPLKAAAFDSPAAAETFVKNTRTDVLLISEKYFTEEMRELNVKKTMVLTEEKDTEIPDAEGVYKYYPGDVILREVESAYEAELKALRGAEYKSHNCAVYGIYSPVGGSGKTSFALTLGQELARDHRVLYMNMESCSALDTILGVSNKRNISDLVYFLRQDCRDFTERFSEMTVSIQNLDCVMPVSSFEDISCTKASEWMDIIDRIASGSMYDIILIEPAGSLQGFIRIMECCSLNFMPYRGDVISMAKIDAYERMLGECGAGEIVEKTVRVKVPYINIAGLGRNYYESLIWSELGDCVRGLIKSRKIA